MTGVQTCALPILILRCDYPFYERNSVCLNVDGSEWAAYKEVKEGTEFSVSYLLLMGEAEDLTEASWKSSKVQMERILKPEVELPFTLKEAQKYRTQLVHNSYKRFEEKKGNPSGYFLHFSPRKRFGDHHLLEYGFTGAQTLLAYDMLVAACRDEFDVPLTGARENAIHALDYFVDNCIEDTGLPNGIYNVDTEQVVYWWTGILFPFQYSRDREMLEEYLGNQIVSSLMAVAETLGKVKGNYCRSMTDTMLYLMKSYLHEKERGCEHTKWLEAVKRYCDKLVEIQNENGSWNRGYSMDGVPLTEPAEWFGRNEIERGSGAIFPIPLLIDLYHLTGNYAYYESARKAASFILKTYVANVYYIGGINDTSHKKSVKMDAASVMFVMRSLLVMYEETKEQEFLEGAVKAAKILVTWTYIWDVPYDENTLLGEHGFKTTGWAVCDAIPAGSYVDCSFFEVIPELMRVAELSEELILKRVAVTVVRGMQHGLSMPQDMYGYAMPGVQCEGYMNSLWLADTEYKEFSGAAAKNKGDDNDTCNGFVNGMALLALDYMNYHQ